MRILFRTLLWFVELAIAIAFLLAIIIAILPQLLSFRGTRSMILSVLSQTSGRQITVQEGSFSWFGGQKIQGLSILDQRHNTRVCAEEVATDATLWQILVTNHDLGTVRILSPYFTILAIEPHPLATVDIHKAGFFTDICTPWDNAARHFSGKVVVQNGTVEITGSHIDNVFFRNITLEGVLQKGESLTFQLHGDTAQQGVKEELLGNFFLNGTISGCGSEGANAAVKGGISQLPVLGLDQMLSLARPELEGLLAASLGPTLDLSLTALLGQGQGEVVLDLISSQMKATINATAQDGKIVLRAPATLSLAVTPGLVTYLFAPHPLLNHLKLASSSQLLLTVETLSVPFHGAKILWDQLNLKSHVNVSNAAFDTPALAHRINLKALQGNVSSTDVQKELLIDLQVALQYGATPSAVASVAQIASPFEHPSLVTWTLSADQFPVAFIDHLLMKNGSFEELLGNAVNINFGLEPEGDNSVATLYMTTPQLTIDGAVVTTKPYIQLKKPFNVLYSPAAWLQNYFPSAAITPIQMKVHDFSLGDTLSTLVLHAEAATDAFNIDNYVLAQPKLLLDIQSLNSIAISAQAVGLSGALHMSYDEPSQVLSSKDLTRVSIELQPALWAPFSTAIGYPTQLIEPSSIQFEVQPFSLPLATRPLDNLALNGSFLINNFYLTKNNNPSSRFALRNTSLRWRLDNEKKEFSARGEGQITGATDAWSPFYVESLVRNLNQPKPDIVFKCADEALDTTALDPWMDSSHSLAFLFGSPLNFKFDLSDKENVSAFTLEAKSDRMHLSCGLARENGELVLRSRRQPILMDWTISPEGFAVGADLWEKTFHENLPLALSASTVLTGRIDALSLPVREGSFAPAPNALGQALFSGTLAVERAPFIDKRTQEPLTFSHLELQIQRGKLEAPLQFRLQSTVEAAKPGLAELQGSIQGGPSPHSNIEANFQNMPTLLPDLAATLLGSKPGTLRTIFGSMITGTLQADIQDSSGPVSLKINSPSTRLSLSGRLDDGVLTLSEPLVAQVTLTPDYSRTLLEQTNPLSVDIVTSEGPMTLTVDKEGFSFPVLPLDIPSAEIKHARIDLGRITCHNQGNVNDLLGLLKQGQFSRSQDLKLWFAPMDLSLKNGIIDCERTEILVADHLDVCTWGEVDLNKNRVDAVLGLTSQALQSAFGIKNLPSDYVLRLPMKGPIGNVKIDTKKATAKIALLLASQNLSSGGGLIQGSKGALVGGLLGAAAKLPDSKNPAPPAKHPFPWETSEQQKPPVKKKKSAIKPHDRPLKQLIKLFRN